MPTDQPLGAGIADQQAPATRIEDWKRPSEAVPAAEDGFYADLPSGNRVFMTRTLDMPILLRTGRIPNPLAGIVQKMIDTRSTAFPKEAAEPEVIMQLLDLLNETAVRCIIEPPFDAPAKRQKGETAEEVTARLEDWLPAFTKHGLEQHREALEADPNHDAKPLCGCQRKISVWDLTMEDRFFIFAVAQGAAADLASFREQQASHVADLQAGEGVRKPTKRTGGTRPKKKK